MALSIKEYEKIINNSKKDYEKICNLHNEYNSNLKEYSSDEISIINFQSNTTVKDLKDDFEEFERWYSKFFNQLCYRLDKYYDVLKEYDDVDDAYNYKHAVTDCVYVLLGLINDQQRFIGDVDIDSNLFNVKKYVKCLGDLSKSLMKLE